MDVLVSSSPDELDALRTIADYQFGRGAGAALFPVDKTMTIKRSTSGRPRQILVEDGRLVTFGGDGRFTLGFAGGYRLANGKAPVYYRVVVGEESEPFVRDGSNAFAKFVISVDTGIRPGDEVLVMGQEDEMLLGVGRAELSADGMADFATGVAVSVREGRDSWASHD